MFAANVLGPLLLMMSVVTLAKYVLVKKENGKNVLIELDDKSQPGAGHPTPITMFPANLAGKYICIYGIVLS